MNVLDIKIRAGSDSIPTILFIDGSRINTVLRFGTLRLIFVINHVALVIEGELQQPLEDVRGVGWVRDTGSRIPTVDAGDPVFGGRPPMQIAVRQPLPALDSGEQPFYSWAILPDGVIVPVPS